jgi:hypothetical protein
LTADVGIVRAIDRAAAPLANFAELVEGLAEGRDPKEVVAGFRKLHRELTKGGIGTEHADLYQPGAITAELMLLMIGDLASRVYIAAEKLRADAEEVAARIRAVSASLLRVQFLLTQTAGAA